MPRGGRRTKVELCNHGSNRLRSVPAAWVALARHAWSRAARRSRAFAASVPSEEWSGLSWTASLLRPNIGREGLPSQRPERKVSYGVTQRLGSILCGFAFWRSRRASDHPAPGQMGPERTLICACPTGPDGGGCSSAPFSCRLRKLKCIFAFRSPAEALCLHINGCLNGVFSRSKGWLWKKKTRR